MTIQLRDFIKTHKHFLPDFIKNNYFVQNSADEEKPFAGIGLKNCHEKLSNETNIVFTSDGNDGFYDLATMSERGIRSCQSWTCEAHRMGVVGTLLDPYVGIIYITNKEPNSKGTTMLKRALVRYIRSNDYCYNYKLLVERIYSNNPGHLKMGDGRYNNIDNQLYNTKQTFFSFLRKKTRNIGVVYGEDIYSNNFTRPQYKNCWVNGVAPQGCVDSGVSLSSYY